MTNKDISFDEIIDQTYEAGELWAQTATIHHRYREGEKAKLAEIKHKIRSTQPLPEGKKAWSKDDLDEAALASPEWKKYLNEWTDAYEAMLRARNTFDAWNSTFEAKRSMMASERTLGKLG